MTIDELKNKLRADFATHIRPLVLKNKCEMCGCEEDLEVHHDKRFIDQLKEVLNMLHIEDYENIPDELEQQIRLMMLGSQIKTKNITLCMECHDKAHSKNTNSIIVACKKIDKEKELEEKNKSITEYLTSIKGKKLYKNGKEELIQFMDIRKNGKQKRSARLLNEYLKENNIPFIISVTEEKRKGKKPQIVWKVRVNSRYTIYDLKKQKPKKKKSISNIDRIRRCS